MKFSALLISALAIAVQAAPSPLEKRSTTCGPRNYSTAQVNAAAQEACKHLQAGTQIGRNNYPHRFNNREGFNFDVSGPYQEFPMRTDRIYDGGDPGADRVVIDEDCNMAGQITHTGASGNGFVGCSGTS